MQNDELNQMEDEQIALKNAYYFTFDEKHLITLITLFTHSQVLDGRRKNIKNIKL